MPNFTPNLNLKKPLTTEYYNIADFNDNMDTLDGALEIASQAEAEAGADNSKIMTPLSTKLSIEYNDKSPIIGTINVGAGVGPFNFTLPVEPLSVYINIVTTNSAYTSHKGLVKQGDTNIYMAYFSTQSELRASLSGDVLTIRQGTSDLANSYNYVLYR